MVLWNAAILVIDDSIDASLWNVFLFIYHRALFYQHGDGFGALSAATFKQPTTFLATRARVPLLRMWPQCSTSILEERQSPAPAQTNSLSFWRSSTTRRNQDIGSQNAHPHLLKIARRVCRATRCRKCCLDTAFGTQRNLNKSCRSGVFQYLMYHTGAQKLRNRMKNQKKSAKEVRRKTEIWHLIAVNFQKSRNVAISRTCSCVDQKRSLRRLVRRETQHGGGGGDPRFTSEGGSHERARNCVAVLIKLI